MNFTARGNPRRPAGARIRNRDAPFIGLLMVLLSSIMASTSCRYISPPTQVPMVIHRYEGPRSDGKTLFILLPGMGDRGITYQKRGFVETFFLYDETSDIVAVDAHFGYYKNESLVARLLWDVVEPARTNGYCRIWLVGISMGGLGAAAFATDHPEKVDGLILLAPYLGDPSLIAAIENEGGLGVWRPQDEDDRFESLWKWLGGYAENVDRPELYLGWGTDDRLSPALELLAPSLAGDHVYREPGGHGWVVWSPLWERILRQRATGEPEPCEPS